MGNHDIEDQMRANVIQKQALLRGARASGDRDAIRRAWYALEEALVRLLILVDESWATERYGPSSENELESKRDGRKRA